MQIHFWNWVMPLICLPQILLILCQGYLAYFKLLIQLNLRSVSRHFFLEIISLSSHFLQFFSVSIGIPGEAPSSIGLYRKSPCLTSMIVPHCLSHQSSSQSSGQHIEDLSTSEKQSLGQLANQHSVGDLNNWISFTQGKGRFWEVFYFILFFILTHLTQWCS